MSYSPGSFQNEFETGNGTAIWNLLNSNDNLVRMETASYLGRPAAEAVSPQLLMAFGDDVRSDRTKQMIGHMIRQVMERRGYHLDQQNVKITRAGNMFSRATRYRSSKDDDLESN